VTKNTVVLGGTSRTACFDRKKRGEKSKKATTGGGPGGKRVPRGCWMGVEWVIDLRAWGLEGKVTGIGLSTSERGGIV